MILWTRRRAKTLHRQWRLIEDASVLLLSFINRPSVLQRRAGVVKPTESIEFHDSPGVSSFVLLSLPLPFPWESLGDSVTLYRMHARVSFLLPELFSSGQQGRSRSTRSITGDPSDGGQVLLDYISSLVRSGHLRDACIQRKSAISPTSRRATGFHCKKSILPIVLYYHAYSNNFLFCRFIVSRLSELFDVSNCIWKTAMFVSCNRVECLRDHNIIPVRDRKYR